MENENTDKTRKVLYVGKDQSYYDSLQEKYKTMYPKEEFIFSNLCKKENEKKSTFLHKISSDVPDIVYIDYSQFTDNMLLLARNLKREVSTKKCTIIGLLENLDSKKTLTSSLAMGVNLNLIKGVETTNAVHHPMTISFPDIAVDADFALAKNKFSLNAITLFRLSYVTDQHMHIESSFQFEKGVPVNIVSRLGLKKDLSHNYLIVSTQDYNIYSNHNFAYDIKYDHMETTKIDLLANVIDQVELRLKKNPKDSNLKYELEEKNAELNEALQEAEADAAERPGALKEWIDASSDGSLPKRAKILMIDQDMSCLYKSTESFDSFPFSIQLHSGIDKEFDLIHRVQPGVVAIKLDSPDSDNIKNDLETLQLIISQVKKQEHLTPIILVFNCSKDLDALKKAIGYELLIVSPNNIEFDFIKKCLEIYQKKGGRDRTHDPEASTASEEKRVYLGKNDDRSILNYTIPIDVNFLSETDLVFDSDVEIPLYTSLYIKSPVKMTITVVPFKKTSKRTVEGGKYYALINGIGELEMTNLRKYINDLIFKKELSDKK